MEENNEGNSAQHIKGPDMEGTGINNTPSRQKIDKNASTTEFKSKISIFGYSRHSLIYYIRNK